MTQLDRTLFAESIRDTYHHPNGPDGIGEFEVDLFQMSLEAHDLAVLSCSRYSFADLYASGTWQKYEQRAAALARKHVSRDPFDAYLANEKNSNWTGTNSRQSYRSALVRLAAQSILELAPGYWRHVIISVKDDNLRRQLIRDLKPHADDETRDRIRHVTEAPSPSDIRKLRRSVEFLNRTPPDPDQTAVRHRRTEPERQDTKSASKASKKATLYALNRHQRRKAKAHPGYNWRDHFWGAGVLPDPHIDDNRRACIAVLMLTGCRPSELSDDLGVTVSALERTGQANLVFEIAGAKLADAGREAQGKGQELRTIEVRCQTPEAIWLLAYVSQKDSGQRALNLEAPTHSQTGLPLSPTERRRRVSERLGKLIGRLGEVALPRFQHRLTPYVFRHALSSDLRAIGGTWSREDVAVALGHQSARTQTHYGSGNSARRLTGSRADQVTEVYGVSPVRNPDCGPYPENPNPKRPTA